MACHRRPRFNDRAMPYMGLWQYNYMRTDKHIMLNHYGFGIFHRSFRAPVKMCIDRDTQTNSAIVANRDGFWVYLVDVDVLTDPDVLANVHTTQAMQAWS